LTCVSVVTYYTKTTLCHLYQKENGVNVEKSNNIHSLEVFMKFSRNKLVLSMALLGLTGMASSVVYAEKPATTGGNNATTTTTTTTATLPAVPLNWTAGTAVVDGNTSDWNLSTDAATRMCEAGWINTDGTCNTKDHLSTLYTRYDCNTNTMYVLVLKTAGHTADNSQSWVKVYTLGNSPRVQGPGNSSSFHDVTVGGVVQGYEASFTLAAGTYNDVEIHIQIDGGKTSSTGKVQYTRSIVVPENCTVPAIVDNTATEATGSGSTGSGSTSSGSTDSGSTGSGSTSSGSTDSGSTDSGSTGSTDSGSAGNGNSGKDKDENGNSGGSTNDNSDNGGSAGNSNTDNDNGGNNDNGNNGDKDSADNSNNGVGHTPVTICHNPAHNPVIITIDDSALNGNKTIEDGLAGHGLLITDVVPPNPPRVNGGGHDGDFVITDEASRQACVGREVVLTGVVDPGDLCSYFKSGNAAGASAINIPATVHASYKDDGSDASGVTVTISSNDEGTALKCADGEMSGSCDFETDAGGNVDFNMVADWPGIGMPEGVDNTIKAIVKAGKLDGKSNAQLEVEITDYLNTVPPVAENYVLSVQGGGDSISLEKDLSWNEAMVNVVYGKDAFTVKMTEGCILTLSNGLSNGRNTREGR
jgi:hypothetical protein